MKLIQLLFVMLSLGSAVMAQKNNNEYFAIDRAMDQIPDSLTKNTQGIAKYVKQNYSMQKDQLRAIFVWIAKNIQYDVENMFAINFYQNTNELIDKTLKNKKGICVGYAELFGDIARKLDIKTYVISGYTKQNNTVDYMPHTWCACYVETSWFFFDPTWGAGYIQSGKFVKKLNNYYFKTKPEQLIKSHMPFDPIWQFLNYPITSQEFYEGKTLNDGKKSFFSFADTLQLFEKQSEIERLISSNNRIEKNGVKNSLVFERLQHNKREIEYYNNKTSLDGYNATVNLFNNGISLLSVFIEYRNKQFTPIKPDADIKQMVDTIDCLFNQVKVRLRTLKMVDVTLENSVTQLDKSLNVAQTNLNEQKLFVNKYLKTGKLFRKSLFKKYTWFGIPIN